jgi:hypothetical protein
LTPPLRETRPEREPLRLDFQTPLLRRPAAPPPPRSEGIVQAILSWLDAQL